MFMIEMSYEVKQRVDRFLDILVESNKIKRETLELEKEKAEIEINGVKEALETLKKEMEF